MATMKGKNMLLIGSIFFPLIVAILFPLIIDPSKAWYVETYSTVQKLNFDNTDTNIQLGTEFVNCISLSHFGDVLPPIASNKNTRPL